MIAQQEETVTQTAADAMIRRVFHIAGILAAVRPAHMGEEFPENRRKNQQSDEVRYGDDSRTTHTV